ncbi:MAG: hypothetical protein EZS28_039553 [Streblomastix strix]|uniref:Uncharacterized protein n=1 Tax=Streblomastix strix TaxID=222440 RepID=A0A5J4U453_9EUKA|nr:MAG: hypothetical protein EZS28_039553 [Streblomastix strix]
MDMQQLNQGKDVQDIVFGDMDCLLEVNNKEINKQIQCEDSKEVKDHLTKQEDKETLTKMDKQNHSEYFTEVDTPPVKQKKRLRCKIDKKSNAKLAEHRNSN